MTIGTPSEPTGNPPGSRWRAAFSDYPAIAKDIFILVLGVLLAFSIDRAGEAWSTDQQTRAVEAALTEEMRVSLGHAVEITALADCRAARVRAMIAAIRAGDPLTARPPLPSRPWTDAVWQSALSSGAAEEVRRERLIAYSRLYGGFQALFERQFHIRDNLLAADVAAFPGITVSDRAEASARLNMVGADLTLSNRIAGQMLRIARDELGVEPPTVGREALAVRVADCGAFPTEANPAND